MKGFKIKIRSTYICVMMSALIISMSCIRYFLNIHESNAFIYSIYIVFILSSFLLYRENYKYLKYLKLIPIMGILFLLYGFITSIIGGFGDVINAVKLFLVFMTAISFFLMKLDDLRLSINFSYLLLFIFIISILRNPYKIDKYLRGGSNYLVLSLPIGLMLAMMLTRIICRLYLGDNIRKALAELVVSLLSFMALIRITGRGSMIFPFITSGVMVILLGRKHIFKRFFILILFSLVSFFAYKYFMKHASGYILAHMLQLFSNTSDEDRWQIWRNTIYFIRDDMHWLIGGGIGASVRNLGAYPHNIYLQCIAEFGLIGAVYSIYITLYSVWIQVDVVKNPFRTNEHMMLFAELSAGAIYLLLNFLKSFPIYDSVVLMIMTFGLISVYSQCKKEAYSYTYGY